MHALIDCDIFCYEIGSMCNPETGVPLPWGVIKRLVDHRIEDILEKTKAESWEGFLTGPGNFRFEVATIQPYKENRGDSAEKPFWYQGIYQYLRDQRNCTVVCGREADDEMAIIQSTELGTVICTRDKDLRQVPGYHYGWESGKQKEKPVFWVNELDGFKSFMAQCLTGDPVDNIPGLYWVGENAASVRRVQQADTELQCFEIVKQEYRNRFGSYWDQFLCENGRLLWMLRHEEDDWYERQKEYDQWLNAENVDERSETEMKSGNGQVEQQ